MKNTSRNMYRKWRRTNKAKDLTAFFQARKLYFKKFNTQKKEYENSVQEKLMNVKNSQEFWNAVQKQKPKNTNRSKEIPIETWTDYLNTLQPNSPL